MFQTNEHSGPVVYSTSQRTQPVTAQKPLSIKFIAYTSATIIVALFMGITAANLMLAKGHFQEMGPRDVPPHLADMARSIEAQLGVFNEIVKHVAAQPTTKDILEYQDEPGSQAWALQMRRFFPQATTVALMTQKGKVLGEASGKSLAPQCLTDMTKIVQNEHVMTPAIHQEPSGTTHFDLTAPVLDEAENPIGMLFVSIGLDTLSTLLQKGTANGSQLSLLDGYGNPIVQQGSLNDTKDAQQSQIKLAGTDWQLKLLEPAGANAGFLSLAIFNISAILLTVGVIAFLVRYITRSMGRDFEQVKTILTDLAEGELQAEVLPTPRLRETAQVFPAISRLHRNIDKKEQLLEHHELSDKLTGLSNRRQFNIEFARAYDFARRGTPVCVVIMRVSGLNKLTNNQINEVVKILGKTLKEHSRRVDHAARLDLGEFALLMFGANPEGTTPCLERICRSFRSHQTEHPAIPNDSVCSLDCGYTRIHAHRDSNAAEVLKRAEAALTEAQDSPDLHIISA